MHGWMHIICLVLGLWIQSRFDIVEDLDVMGAVTLYAGKVWKAWDNLDYKSVLGLWQSRLTEQTTFKIKGKLVVNKWSFIYISLSLKKLNQHDYCCFILLNQSYSIYNIPLHDDIRCDYSFLTNRSIIINNAVDLIKPKWNHWFGVHPRVVKHILTVCYTQGVKQTSSCCIFYKHIAFNKCTIRR